jgi:hypothetical protein
MTRYRPSAENVPLLRDDREAIRQIMGALDLENMRRG